MGISLDSISSFNLDDIIDTKFGMIYMC